MSLALAGRFFTTSATWEAPYASVANENENEKELGQMYPVTLDSCWKPWKNVSWYLEYLLKKENYIIIMLICCLSCGVIWATFSHYVYQHVRKNIFKEENTSLAGQ